MSTIRRRCIRKMAIMPCGLSYSHCNLLKSTRGLVYLVFAENQMKIIKCGCDKAEWNENIIKTNELGAHVDFCYWVRGNWIQV